VVAFSGGRDSVALALIARSLRPKIPMVYVDTGLADPQLLTFIRRFGGRSLTYIRNPVDPTTTWRRVPSIPIGAKVSSQAYRRDNPELRIGPSRCCQEHKAKPMDKWIAAKAFKALIVGGRGDDSTRHRFKLMTGEAFYAKAKGYVLSYPLLAWQQQDTLAFLASHYPKYPLMYARNEELGCRCCAVNLARWPNQLQKLRRADPAYHRRVIVDWGFGIEILKIKYGLTDVGARALVDRDGWDRLIDSGALDRIPGARGGWR